MPRDSNRPSFKPCRCACKWRCKCLIPRERRAHPPFNRSAKLGTTIGLHPKLRAELPNTPGVGSYNLPTPRTKCTVPSWDRQKEVEDFAATLGGLVLAERAFQRVLMKTGRGPGTHEIPRWPDTVPQSRSEHIREDVGFGTAPRLPPERKSTTPGPGYTRKVHNPYYYLEQSRLKSFSCLPTFEFDGLAPRFREISKKWSLPSNLYRVRHPEDIENRVMKRTGKRGPYDLFTGPRDESTIKGYMASSKATDKVEWPIALPGELDKLLHKSNYFKGLWTCCPRFPKKPSLRMMLTDINMCYKDPDQPGPGHYNPSSPRKPGTKKVHPFNSSVYPARPISRDDIRPPPGRYNIRDTRRIEGHGWTWAFKSRTRRTIVLDPPPPYNSF